MATKVAKERQGIQSIEVGFQLLRALSASQRPMMLRDLASQSGMPAAKAHRYLVSFMRTGIVEQDTSTGRYDLGGYALELGLSSLGRLDPVRFAGPILDELCEQIQGSVALAVWGNRGATIVRIVDAGGPITVTLRAGTVLPLVNSATGRAFAAFSHTSEIRQLINEELRANADSSRTAVTNLRRQFEKVLSEIRQHGISRASGSLTPGINGFSAPVYDYSGNMVAAITSLGPIGEFDVEWESAPAKAMISAALRLSHRLGYGSIETNAPLGAPTRNRTKT